MPIDEMVMCLRDALDAFDASPNDETYSKVQYEMRRIENECEDLLEDQP